MLTLQLSILMLQPASQMGFVFGLGAEIGISTQKMHARGPMGLEALTSTKFYINGQGQVRE